VKAPLELGGAPRILSVQYIQNIKINKISSVVVVSHQGRIINKLLLSVPLFYLLIRQIINEKTMSDQNVGALLVVLVFATILLSSCGLVFWLCFLSRMTGNDSQYNSQQVDLKVLNHQCEEGCGKCYSVDQNVIKVSCPALVLTEVNELFL
jgi:hypothetical protein